MLEKECSGCDCEKICQLLTEAGVRDPESVITGINSISEMYSIMGDLMDTKEFLAVLMITTYRSMGTFITCEEHGEITAEELEILKRAALEDLRIMIEVRGYGKTPTRLLEEIERIREEVYEKYGDEFSG